MEVQSILIFLGINASDVPVTTDTSAQCVFWSAPLHVNPRGQLSSRVEDHAVTEPVNCDSLFENGAQQLANDAGQNTRDNCEQLPNDDVVQRVEPMPPAGTPLDLVSSELVAGN
ncbi:hypothetical protein V6N13_110653 [Hibiscus sabdariffa]